MSDAPAEHVCKTLADYGDQELLDELLMRGRTRGFEPQPMVLTPKRYFLSYFTDWSAMAIFDNELEALRYAILRWQTVLEVKLGDDLREQVGRQFQ